MLILGNLYISLKTISFLKRKLHRDTISTHDQCLIRKAKNEEQVTKVIRKLYIYPIVSIILWSVASSSRVYEAILDSHHKDTDEDLVRLILYFLQAVFMSARGLIYTIIYFCRYEKSRKELNTMICGIRRYLCCQKKKKEDTFIGENYST